MHLKKGRINLMKELKILITDFLLIVFMKQILIKILPNLELLNLKVLNILIFRRRILEMTTTKTNN